REPVMEEDRTGFILLQLPIDLPDQPTALFLVTLHRLPVKQSINFRIAIAGVIAVGAAGVILIELRVGVIDTDPGQGQPDLIVFAVNLGEPVGGINGLELAVDKDLSKLVDQDRGRIAERRRIAHRYLDRETLFRAVARLLHQLARVGAVPGDIATVTWQGAQRLLRNAPDPLRRGVRL